MVARRIQTGVGAVPSTLPVGRNAGMTRWVLNFIWLGSRVADWEYTKQRAIQAVSPHRHAASLTLSRKKTVPNTGTARERG